MIVRPSVRFDVFKRDDFTCAYCGRRPPEVTLEVDHIIPRAEGGTNDPENLTTACWDCNHGKGAVPLTSEPSTIPDLQERTELVLERERQLRAYHAAKEEQARRQDEQINEALDYWLSLSGENELRNTYYPNRGSLRRYVDVLGVYEVKDAMDIAAARWQSRFSMDTVKYFYGVCKRKQAQQEGRITLCIYCGDRIVLERGDDLTARWFHPACKEKADG
jgi:hypothetical protein